MESSLKPPCVSCWVPGGQTGHTRPSSMGQSGHNLYIAAEDEMGTGPQVWHQAYVPSCLSPEDCKLCKSRNLMGPAPLSPWCLEHALYIP